MSVQPIPDGYHAVTPYLAVDDASAAIDFYARAFGAKERYRMPGPDGTVSHAELELGDSVIMLSDPLGGDDHSPKEVGATTVGLFMYTNDVDASFRQAIEAGATSAQEPKDMFWGDRFARVTDPFGHSWQLATHVEDVPPEEMERRSAEAMASMPS